ncbi:MAG: ComF family protein [Opitutaceae bacterium]|jgi:ComF family protein
MLSKSSWGELGRGLLDVVFPPGCVHCGGVVEPGNGFRHLCEHCAEEIHFVQAPACEACGHPFFGIVHGERECPHCVGLAPAFDKGVTTVLFKGPARSMVIELKYHRGLHLEPDFEEAFRRSPRVLEFASGAVLVPVPLHVRKCRERGYNQAAFLAKCLVRACEGRVRTEALLVRKVDTGTQTALDRRTRMDNLRNAFALVPGAVIKEGERYLLVDDVFTTGSTLNSCAHALRRGGAKDIGVITFGHG